MTVKLRSVSLVASACFLGLLLGTATGCGTLATAAGPQVASAVAATDDSAASTRPSAGEADPAIAAKKLEIAGLQALVDQEKQALAAKDLASGERAGHASTLANLAKMKAGSEGELAELQAAFVAAHNVEVAAPTLVASRPKAPGVKLSSAIVAAPIPAVASPVAAAVAPSPKGTAFGLAKLGASHVPGGGTALGAASAVAGMAKDPKAGAMELAKLGASHVPGGGAALGAATAVAGMAKDPKGAATDLAKQGATAALTKVPGGGIFKSSLFGK